MARNLIVNNTTYSYPDPGDDPGWGEGATGWAQAVTDVINTLLGPGDIIETIFTIQPEQLTSANITGLLFNPTTVRAAIIEYSIYRRTQELPAGTTEEGTITLLNDDSETPRFKLTREANGDALVDIDIDQLTGQFSYTSQAISLPSTDYVGTMRFRARTLSK